MKISEKHLDVPYDKPSFPIPLNWVTIFNQKEYISIKEIFNNQKIKCILCNIEIGISLSKKFRGIHMSRVENAIIRSSSRTYTSLNEFTQILAKNTFDNQPCEAVKVRVEGIYHYIIETPKSGLKSCQPLNISALSIYDGKWIKKMIGIENNIIIACPCVQRYFSAILKNKKRKANDNELLGSLVTHMQRGKLYLLVENSDVLLDYKDLLSIIKKSTVMPSELLKRPDERYIVLDALNKANFVEDIVREIANDFHKYIINKGSSKNRDIYIKVTSYESIHSHDIYAELKTNLNELQNLLSKDHKKIQHVQK
jgi:GTP cyclohydrolase-4